MKFSDFVIEHLCTFIIYSFYTIVKKLPQFNVAEMTSIQCGLEITIIYRITNTFIKYKTECLCTHTLYHKLHLHKLRGQSC